RSWPSRGSRNISTKRNASVQMTRAPWCAGGELRASRIGASIRALSDLCFGIISGASRGSGPSLPSGLLLQLLKAPARPGLSLLSVHRQAPNQAAKCGVGQLVMTGRPAGYGKSRPVVRHRRVRALKREHEHEICWMRKDVIVEVNAADAEMVLPGLSR